jgi:hypothetical protein
VNSINNLRAIIAVQLFQKESRGYIRTLSNQNLGMMNSCAIWWPKEICPVIFGNKAFLKEPVPNERNSVFS